MDWRVHCRSCLGNFKTDKDLPIQSTCVTPFKPSYCFKAQRDEDINASLLFWLVFFWASRGEVEEEAGRDSIAEMTGGSHGWLRLSKMPEMSSRCFEQCFPQACTKTPILSRHCSQHLLAQPSAGTSAAVCLLFLMYKQKTMLSWSSSHFEFLPGRSSSLRLLCTQDG